MKRETKKTVTTFLAQAETTWVVYAGVLAVLTLSEALVKPEVGFDTILDWTILATAFLGGAAAWVLYARLVLADGRGRRPLGLALRIGAGWFVGPVLALCVILGINGMFGGDIDGGLLLFYLAFLAIVLPVFVLPVVMFVWSRRQVAVEIESKRHPWRLVDRLLR